MTSPPRTLGVVGAGTMGAGIAQLGVGAGIRTLLHDQIPEALERGVEHARKGLAKWAERGREVDPSLLEPAPSLDDLAQVQIVIEAAPERFELKRELFERLSLVVGEDAVLATNTSWIPVTSLASAVTGLEDVLVASTASSPTSSDNRSNSSRLSSKRSGAASMTSSAGARSSSDGAGSSSEASTSRPRSLHLARPFRTPLTPLSSASGIGSWRSVRTPAPTPSWAMPAPIVPAPTTPRMRGSSLSVP